MRSTASLARIESESTKRSHSPLLMRKPWWHAQFFPTQPSGSSSPLTILPLPSPSTTEAAISEVLSVDQSSTTTNSRFLCVCPAIDLKHLAIVASSFLVGTITLTSSSSSLVDGPSRTKSGYDESSRAL